MSTDREQAQKKITEKLGWQAIEEARGRLCNHCSRRSGCLLLPRCLDGSDCPYFQRMEVNSDA
jgi:predicted nucleic acid-binding Zn ribbon protein